MVRAARLVVPNQPHHVTQRGNRRMDTFFGDDDYRAYLEYLSEWSEEAGTEVWAYCLMPNHVHLILVPRDEDGLRAALGETHRRYSRRVNQRNGWTGHLWQSRFASFPMDEAHLLNCTRYVELNPVRAGLVKRADHWKWSSTKAHIRGEDDDVVRVAPMLKRVGDWRAFLRQGLGDAELEEIRSREKSGFPLGSSRYLKRLEARTGRQVMPGKRGRPRLDKK